MIIIEFENDSQSVNKDILRERNAIMRKTLSLALSLVLAAIAVAAPVAADDPAGSPATSATDSSAEQRYVSEYNRLLQLLNAQPVDLNQVKQTYETSFRAAVKARKPQIDEEVSVVLNAGLQGQATAGQVKQALDKGLQWFFYEEINALVGQAATALQNGDTAAAKTALARAETLFDGTIYVTAGKRDQNFSTLTQNVLKNVALPGLKQAIDKRDTTEFGVFRQYFQKTMMKVFVLGTMRYGAVVETDYKAGNTDAVKEHIVEGYFFFMPIYQYFSTGSVEAADAIRAAFGSGDGSKVKKADIDRWLARAIAGKINAYANATLDTDLAKGDLSRAKIHAAEGNAFLSQLEVIVKERLGAQAYAELEQHAEQYYAAVAAANAKEARAHAYAILSRVADIVGVRMAIGAAGLRVDGKDVSSSDIASYVDPTSGRTLASVRLVNEALGATVDWNAQSGQATVKKNSKTVVFTLGSRDIVINGQKPENVLLDQPPVVRDNRLYIPLRALAEQLDGKVFWHDGNIVIHY